MWFKEYVFNIIIQPFHLIIYTILVGSALQLANQSLIYTVVAIYFLIPAEKLLRKFFGFDNAGTLSAAGSFAGGAVFSAMINKLNRPKPPEPKDTPEKAKNVRRTTKGAGVSTEDTLFGGSGDVYGDAGGAVASGGPRLAGPGGVGGGTGGTGAGMQSADVLARMYGSNLSGGEATDLYKNLTSHSSRRLMDIARGGNGKPGILGRTGMAMSSMGRHTKAALINKAKTLPKSAGRKLRRVGVGAAGALPLAMLAAGVGAATGDASKAATMAIAAGTAGSHFTNYYGDRLAKGVGAVTDGAKKAFWGNDLREVQQAKYDKEFLSSPDLMDNLTVALGSTSAAKEAIDNGEVQAFLDQNITDKGKIAKAISLKNKYMKEEKDKDGKVTRQAMSEGVALQRSIAMAKLSRDVNPGIYNDMSREQIAFKNNLMKKMTANGLEPSAATQEIDRIMGDLYSFND